MTDSRVLAATMDAARWQELRQLFDAVCDLPSAQWARALAERCDDPMLIEAALALLDAQTVSLDRALRPLGALMDTLADTELRVGDRLGPWQLVERLGSGGMGAVFIAERADDLFHQRVAIKLLHVAVASPMVARRLAKERQILAELHHPNIARLFDGGTTPSGHPYLVMEYIAGLPLDQHCDTHQLGLRARLQLFMRVCHGVQAAHQRLIVHCDLKPSNILVRDEVAPVLLDFGIAQVLDESDEGEHHGFCTPAYASPEQLAHGRVSIVSDVFSLGVLLTELLAVQPLRRDVGDRERPVPQPSRIAGETCGWRGQLRGDLDAIAAKACALDPEQRYASVAALARDIERHLKKRPVQAREHRLTYVAGRYLQRHWRGAAAVAVLALVTTGFIWSLILQRERAQQEADTARKVSDLLVASFASVDPREHNLATPDVTAREVLDRGAARVEHELADAPQVLARMHAVLGRAYSNLGQPLPAEAMLQKAADEFERVEQPDQAALALSRLSTMRIGRQASDDALAPAQRAMQLLSRGASAADRAEVHIAYGAALNARRRWDEGKQALETALRYSNGRNDPQSVRNRYDALRHLAGIYRTQGQYDRAEAMSRQTLAMARRYGVRSAETQASLHSLGMVLYLRGNAREAVNVFTEHLALARAVIGEHSTTVGDAHMDLANALLDQGRYNDALSHSRPSLDIMQVVAGRDSTEYALVLNSAAHLQQARGDFAAAERYWREAIAIRQRLYPAHDTRALRYQLDLGLMLAEQGRLDEARLLIEPALVRLEREPALTEPERFALRLKRADWHLSVGDIAQADSLLSAAVPERAQHDPRLALRTRVLRARLVQLRGDGAAARRAWQEVLKQSQPMGGETSAATAAYRLAYTRVLLAAGDVTEARAQLRIAAPILRRELAPTASSLRQLDPLE